MGHTTTLRQQYAELLLAMRLDVGKIWRNDHQDIAYMRMDIQRQVLTIQPKIPRFVGMNKMPTHPQQQQEP